MYCVKGSRGGVHELYKASGSLGSCGQTGDNWHRRCYLDQNGRLQSAGRYATVTVNDRHGPELLETWANSGIFIHNVPFTSHSRSSRHLASSVAHPPMRYMMESLPLSLHSRMC